jgi:hypothetical protein
MTSTAESFGDFAKSALALWNRLFSLDKPADPPAQPRLVRPFTLWACILDEEGNLLLKDKENRTFRDQAFRALWGPDKGCMIDVDAHVVETTPANRENRQRIINWTFEYIYALYTQGDLDNALLVLLVKKAHRFAREHGLEGEDGELGAHLDSQLGLL